MLVTVRVPKTDLKVLEGLTLGMWLSSVEFTLEFWKQNGTDQIKYSRADPFN